MKQIKQFKLTLVLLVIGIGNALAQYQPGVPYEDAVRFLKYINTDPNVNNEYNNKQELLRIISYYFGSNITTQADFTATLNSNNFLLRYSGIVIPAPPANISTPTSPAGGGSGGLLGMDVTNIADGIAKFLIKRGKQELSMAFFEKFKKELQKFPELSYLFPKSKDLVQNIDSYNYPTLLQELKDAFSKDLVNMPNNILSLRNITIAECNGNVPCTGRVAAINSAFISSGNYDSRMVILPLLIIQGIIDGNNIIEISNKITADATICDQRDNLSGLVQLSSILLESFRNGNQTNNAIFIDQGRLKNLFTSNDLLNIFLGLVYQKYHTMPCYTNLQVAGHNFEYIFNLLSASRTKFYSTLSSFDKINFAFAAIQKNTQQSQKTDVNYYVSVVSASLSMLSNTITSISTLMPGSLPPNFDRFSNNIKIGSDICNDIQQKSYAGIFNSSIKLITYNNIIADNDTRSKVVKYLSFAANLASATTSDEVQNALETVALPPGSYSIKQKSAVNISLNGYVGYGWDINNGNGVYAPVGFTGSVGLGKNHQWALSLFTSMIDVGGLVSYRLTDGVTNELKQEVRLESIVSPSAQLMVGIPKTPIAVCAGWRMTPKLFYSSQNSFQTVPAKNVFNIAVLIDIPIFTLFNRPYSN